MVIFKARRFILWRETTIYFPHPEAIERIAAAPAPGEIVRFSQAPIVPDSPYLLRHHEVATTCLDLSMGPQALYRAMDPKSCRYPIRRAEKMNGRLEIDSSGDAGGWNDFAALYNRFVGTKRFAAPLTSARLAQWKRASDLFVIRQSGRAMCGHVLLRDEEAGRARLMFSVNRGFEAPEDRATIGALNRYLHWHEILHYCGEGFRIFDFGGIGDGSNGIARFKLSFGGSIRREHSFVITDKLTAAAHSLYRTLPLPTALRTTQRFA